MEIIPMGCGIKSRSQVDYSLEISYNKHRKQFLGFVFGGEWVLVGSLGFKPSRRAANPGAVGSIPTHSRH